jgi:hypothetical protein
MSAIASEHAPAAALSRRERIAGALHAHAIPLLFCAAVWVACHPYPGMVGDARIYIGRALADLDPSGVGQDMIFVHDGQFKFTLFPLLMRGLVMQLGASRAAELLAATACLSWFAAAYAFARQLVTGRAVWLMLMFICVLPHGYGNHMFVPAEALAVPRPFAEAAVLAALAAVIAGRTLLAIALIALGFALHPIMGLPGLIVIAVMYLRGPRAIAAGVALVPACVLAVYAGLPLFDRLFTAVDPEWLDLLFKLDPYLFPTHWSLADYSPLAVQTATIAVAASLLIGVPRRLFIAVLLVGLGGHVVAIIAGDVLHNLLAVQVQPWRAAWLLAVIGQCAYALCAIRLSTGEMQAGQRRVTLALLTLGWFGNLSFFLALPVAASALVVYFVRFRTPLPFRTVVVIWIVSVSLILSAYADVFTNFLRFVLRMPSGAGLGLLYALRMDVLALPVCLAALLWWLTQLRVQISPALRVTALLVSVVAAAAIWSSRSQAGRDFESMHMSPEFAALIDGRPGEVLWVDAKSETWQVLGRPQWGSAQQSVSVVFSRPLAMLWRERAEALLANGLIQANVLLPWRSTDISVIPNVTRVGIDNICTRPDGPAAVVFPLAKGQALPHGVSGPIWTLPHPRLLSYIDEKYIWQEVDRYAAVPCPDKARQDPSLSTSSLRGGLL